MGIVRAVAVLNFSILFELLELISRPIHITIAVITVRGIGYLAYYSLSFE